MALPPPLRALRKLLFDPESFFENRSPIRTLPEATLVVLATASCVTLAFAAIGRMFAVNIDATYTRTEMEPWPDAQCEQFDDMGTAPEPCQIDESRTTEVDVGAEVWDVFVGYLPWVFVGLVVSWVLIAVGLHLLSALFDAEGSFAGTLAVVGWAMPLEFLQAAVGVGVLAATAYGTEFASDPDVLADQLQTMTEAGVSLPGTVAAIVVIGWQAYIWTYGIARARSLDTEDAALSAGVLGIVLVVLVLL